MAASDLRSLKRGFNLLNPAKDFVAEPFMARPTRDGSLRTGLLLVSPRQERGVSAVWPKLPAVQPGQTRSKSALGSEVLDQASPGTPTGSRSGPLSAKEPDFTGSGAASVSPKQADNQKLTVTTVFLTAQAALGAVSQKSGIRPSRCHNASYDRQRAKSFRGARRGCNQVQQKH